MQSLPAGTITFFLTDIQGSTQLWEQSPERMRAALALHNAAAAAAIQEHNGILLKSRGEGDSLFAVFPRAMDAVAAACAFQIALSAQHSELKVRIAIHTGEADLCDGDYYGPAVNRCARLRAIAHGGQVLLSRATQELVGDALPAGATLRDMGLHRLRDLGRPEHVFHLLHPALRADFPPLNSLGALPNNLPLQLTSFIGREREIAALKQALTENRLLTLLGPGGCGKTRLALQAAAELLEAYPDGIWQVELAALTDPELVPQTVASVLGVREEPGRSLTATLMAHLAPKKLLLLLDNCEHLLAACAPLADSLLRSGSDLRILATSREALGIPGEITWLVPSLALPEQNPPPPLSALAECEAVRLFVERAALAVPGFALSHRNAPAVARICTQLDGMPLAIELAAARIRVLAVEQIAERLTDRFRLLTNGGRTVLPRHQTLRAMMDWSYDLLSDEERVLLRRLAVFSGGWCLEAAEAVCADSDEGEGFHPSSFILHPFDVLALLAQLIGRSLVIKEEREGAARYRLLNTVRQYAWDKLKDAGEQADIAGRHRAFFLALAERAAPHLTGEDQAEWLDALETEHDNLRAALEYAGAAAGGAEGLRLAIALYRFWTIRGYITEGRDYLAVLLNRAGREHEKVERARALTAAGALAWDQGDYAAARRLFEESLTLRRQLEDRLGIADVLNNLGNVTWDQGDYATARALLEESMEIMRAEEDREGIAAILENLALLSCEQGEYATARRLFEEGLALDRELKNNWAIARSLDGLAEVAFREENYTLARTLREDSLKMRREIGDRQGIAECLEGLAAIGVAQGQPRPAACLLGAAERLRETLGSPLPPRKRDHYEGLITRLRAALNDGDFDTLRAQGRAMSWEQAATYVLDEFPRLPAEYGDYAVVGNAAASPLPPVNGSAGHAP